MSVDDRLREAFAETDSRWDERVPDALAALTARHRHENAVRRGATAALVAAAAVTAVIVIVSSQGDPDPVPAPSPTPTPSTGDEPNPLHGTWVSEPVTRADVRRAARLAGDADDADAMLASLPPLPFRVVIYVNADRSSLHTVFRAEGRDEETADEENVTVTEDTLVMQPMFETGENVHTWVLDGGDLRLAFVSTTEAEGDDGVPGEAWQRLLYDTAAFTSGT